MTAPHIVDPAGVLSEALSDASPVAASIREHIVDRKVNNSRTVDTTDPTVLAPVG